MDQKQETKDEVMTRVLGKLVGRETVRIYQMLASVTRSDLPDAAHLPIIFHLDYTGIGPKPEELAEAARSRLLELCPDLDGIDHLGVMQITTVRTETFVKDVDLSQDLDDLNKLLPPLPERA
jgi:hypothetical protein